MGPVWDLGSECGILDLGSGLGPWFSFRHRAWGDPHYSVSHGAEKRSLQGLGHEVSDHIRCRAVYELDDPLDQNVV
jgi:hypothetical protein